MQILWINIIMDGPPAQRYRHFQTPSCLPGACTLEIIWQMLTEGERCFTALVLLKQRERRLMCDGDVVLLVWEWNLWTGMWSENLLVTWETASSPAAWSSKSWCQRSSLSVGLCLSSGERWSTCLIIKHLKHILSFTLRMMTVMLKSQNGWRWVSSFVTLLCGLCFSCRTTWSLLETRPWPSPASSFSICSTPWAPGRR